MSRIGLGHQLSDKERKVNISAMKNMKKEEQGFITNMVLHFRLWINDSG